jgi:hypothetical protein
LELLGAEPWSVPAPVSAIHIIIGAASIAPSTARRRSPSEVLFMHLLYFTGTLTYQVS